eukprot:jgi/Psemu1/48344/gm1.48344_g
MVGGMWLADNDYGEQFLNFPLHSDLRKCCGVDLSQLVASAPNEPGATGVWMRNAMGLKSSPYNSIQGLLGAKQIIQYVDDIQIMAPDSVGWAAARKQRSPSKEPGAWTGATVSTNSRQVCKGVTKDRWIKLQSQIHWIALQVNMCDKHTKVGREDPPQNAQIMCELSSLCGNDIYVYGPLPQGTLPHPEFLETPPEHKGMGHSPLLMRQKVHSTQWRSPHLGVHGEMIHAEFGAWSEKVSNKSSSNFREAANLVELLKHKVGSGTIPRGSEVFLFMVNLMVESTMYKGSSSSELLHNMILELQKMQGTDSLSRGDFTSSVMAGEAFLKGQSTWKFTSPDDCGNVQCKHCKKQIFWLSGIVCANFGSRTNAGITNYGAWYPECFSQAPGDQFPSLTACDLDNCLVDNELMEDDDTQRLKKGGTAPPCVDR